MATRIGVFFDGTGNNMWNDMAIGDGSQTNIAKLYQLYDKTNGFEAIYAEGVGTEAYTQNHTFSKTQIDSVWGDEKGVIGENQTDRNTYYEPMSLAFAESAKDMVEKKLAEIQDYIDKHPTEEIIIDVYGFSRGATQARDFINEINKSYVGTEFESVIGFVGLFDTVASVGFANEYNYGYNLNLNEHSAQTIFHIVAQDEERGNFPLESLASNGTNITQTSTQGVHSDIGGGYGILDTHKKIVVEEIYKVYFDEQSGLDRVTQLQAQADAEGYTLEYQYSKLPATGDWGLQALLIEDKEFGYGLSNVSLNSMYNQIQAAGISLAPLSSLGGIDYNGTTYSNWEVPANIDESYVHISASNSWYGESITDWLANHKDFSGKRSDYPNEPNEAQDFLQSFNKYDRTFMKLSKDSQGKVFGNPISFSELGASGFSDAYIEKRTEFFYYLLDEENRYKPLGDDVASYKDTELGVLLHNTTSTGKSYATDKTTDRIIFDSDKIQSDGTLQTFDWTLDGTSSGNNYLFGMGGDDVLFSGSGNDYLEGGEGKDTLIGGGGFDTYVAGDGDRLYDNGGDGKVFFEDSELYDGSASTKGHALSGGVQISEGSNIYRGDGGEYELINNTLLFTKNEKTVTIGGYSSGNLGITLTKLSDSGGDTGGSDGSGTGGGTGTDDGTTDTEDETVYATPYDDILILTDEDDTMDGLAGDDYIEGKAGNDILIGNAGDDILWGGVGDDFLYGDNGNDILFGDTGDDYLEGGTGDDLLYGGDGDDVLLGSDGSDYLNGGMGFDYYVTDTGDTIEDSDGRGAVFFNNADISGTKKKNKESGLYEDDDNIYERIGGGLLVTSKGNGTNIIIENWSNKALGIVLGNGDDEDEDEDDHDDSDGDSIAVSVGDAEAMEAAEMMRISVSLQRALGDDEQLEVQLGYYINTYINEPTGRTITVPAREAYTSKYYDSYSQTWHVQNHPAQASYTYAEQRRIQTGQAFRSVGSVTFEPGEQEKTFTYRWQDDDLQEPNDNFTLTSKANEDTSSYGDDIEITVGKEGSATIIDDDERGRYDPLVLDTNKDGFIATTPLDDSNTYFDITGDGLRERIGWVSPEDGLLVFDKNDNGQIDGISELFGSLQESGFEELKRLVDSNHDNKIDRRDELFNRLQIWNDKNGDAKVQEGELSALKDTGVTSIDLNYVATNIEINGNLLTEASKYTDTQGNKELVADIQLATDVKDTKVELADIPNFTIDPTTELLPQLKGSGLVHDAFIKYNTSEEFKALAEDIKNNHKTISICQDSLRHVKMNNRDFKFQREVA